MELGSFFVGGAPIGPDSPPIITCSANAPKELRTHFPANIIYVQKSKTPKYFIEPYNINCDYKEKGVVATKLGPLVPVKPVMRQPILKRVY